MKKTGLLFSALAVVVFTSAAMARDPQIVAIKAGASAEVNYGSVQLACGLVSHDASLKILNFFDVVGNDGYYTKQLKVKAGSDLSLAIEKTEISQLEGTECNYQGHLGWDPDYRCSESKYGYWSVMTVYMSDATDNTWTFTTKTRMLDVKSDRLNDIEAQGLLFSQLISGCDLKQTK